MPDIAGYDMIDTRQALERFSAICVLGGSGFVGRHLMAALPDPPPVPIRLLTRTTAERAGPAVAKVLIKGDFRDQSALERLIVPGALVINLAFQPRRLADNLAAARVLAEVCAKTGAARLIHLSTAVVAGRSPEPVIAETTPEMPYTDYEKVKLAIERVLRRRLAGVCPTTVLRPTAVFGPGGANLVKLADELIREPEWLRVLKNTVNGTRRMNLVCVENLVAAIGFVAGLDPDPADGVFIVSDDDAPANTYTGVVGLLTGQPAKSLPLAITGRFAPLPLVLRIKGRGNVNPQRQYSSAKLTALGFFKATPFDAAVIRFARHHGSRRQQGIDSPIRGKNV